MMTRCRSCEHSIRWAKTPSGESMPLDADPHPEGNILLGWVGGEELAIVVTDENELASLRAQRVAYRSHFATCPDADRWRVAPIDGQLTFSCTPDERGGVDW